MSGVVQPAITMVNFVVTKVDFFIPPGMDEIPNFDIEVNHRISFDPNVDQHFMVHLQVATVRPADDISIKPEGVDIPSVPNEMKLNVEAVALFRTDRAIDESFKVSHLANINAVAIAFPFVRSFMAMFTASAGVPRLMIPAINFRGGMKAPPPPSPPADTHAEVPKVSPPSP